MDIEQFNTRFTSAVEGCNGCHTALGYGFIKYQLPTAGQMGSDVLDVILKTEALGNCTRSGFIRQRKSKQDGGIKADSFGYASDTPTFF